MKYLLRSAVFISVLICFYSCEQAVKEEKVSKVDQDVNQDLVADLAYDSLALETITGDFNGDGIEDTLSESLTSSINKTSIQSLPRIEYDSLVDWIYKKLPILSLRSKDTNIPELTISKSASFGLLWIKNEGDLNKDGNDEISVVINWADWSQVNRCIVYSLKNNKWIEYAKFDVREWQISRNPDFDGFISKTKKGSFAVSTFDSEMNEILKPLNEMLVTRAKKS